jgi:hypothetical protein
VLILTKAEVAQSQLQTAILLWFHYGDPISILTLANAANDCYSELGGHIGKPSAYRAWLKTQSISFRDRARYVLTWVKHGRKDMTKKAQYAPIIGELLIFDSIECHSNLFRVKTDLMTLFIARWPSENPSRGNAEIRPILLRMVKAYDLADRNRIEFLNEGLKRLAASD